MPQIVDHRGQPYRKSPQQLTVFEFRWGLSFLSIVFGVLALWRLLPQLQITGTTIAALLALWMSGFLLSGVFID